MPPERPLLNRKTWPLFAIGMVLIVVAAVINSRDVERGPNRFYSRPRAPPALTVDGGDPPAPLLQAPR